MNIRSWILGVVVAGSLAAKADAGGLQKKLINFGWDMHAPAELADRIGELQHLPFDGLTVRFVDYCYTFYNRNFDEADVAAQAEAMKKMQWGKFTDNFMYMVAGDLGHWFDDSVWAEDGRILRNVRTIARIGRAGGCRGILFDPELVYWGQPGDPWEYENQVLHGEKSVAEYRAMVRRRGAQFINTIEEHMPATVFLTLFWTVYYSPLKDIAFETDPETVDRLIGEREYGLLHDFMLGVLEGADLETTIVDGNEYGYYARQPEQFNNAYHFIRQTALGAVPEELRYKYRAQVDVGHGIYVALHSNMREKAYLSTYMTPEERAMALEMITYNALRNADEYAWFYTQISSYLRGKHVAPEMIPAVERARRKVAGNDPLGFDFAPIEERAGEAHRRARSADIVPLKARIARAPAPPAVDGKLDDGTWQDGAELGPFTPFLTATQPADVRATVRMAYDDDNLYIGFRCEDPTRERLEADSVEIAIGADAEASKYYHITLTFENRKWDALVSASSYPNEIHGEDASWDGPYESATHVDPAFWSVETAIPWTALDRAAPVPGEVIKGNFILRADRRPSHSQYEFSSWSPMRMNRLPEAKTFGTWEFR